MNTDQLERMKKIKWWHRIDLGDGIITPGCTDPLPKLAYSKLPEKMDGMRVLDIGAWDGWWSFECERRGAKKVVALDQWQFDTGSQGIELAIEVLQSDVNIIQLDAHKITQAVVGNFDLVICLGVLHHLKSPLEVLERIVNVCSGTLILETHLDLRSLDPLPACAVYDGFGPYNSYNDPTIIWGPNEACVKSWLRRAGFKDIEMVGSSTKVWSEGGDRATFHAKT
jgi:tRNA (mo5U34)-methyltransferase